MESEVTPCEPQDEPSTLSAELSTERSDTPTKCSPPGIPHEAFINLQFMEAKSSYCLYCCGDHKAFTTHCVVKIHLELLRLVKVPQVLGLIVVLFESFVSEVHVRKKT